MAQLPFHSRTAGGFGSVDHPAADPGMASEGGAAPHRPSLSLGDALFHSPDIFVSPWEFWILGVPGGNGDESLAGDPRVRAWRGRIAPRGIPVVSARGGFCGEFSFFY